MNLVPEFTMKILVRMACLINFIFVFFSRQVQRCCNRAPNISTPCSSQNPNLPAKLRWDRRLGTLPVPKHLQTWSNPTRRRKPSRPSSTELEAFRKNRLPLYTTSVYDELDKANLAKETPEPTEHLLQFAGQLLQHLLGNRPNSTGSNKTRVQGK